MKDDYKIEPMGELTLNDRPVQTFKAYKRTPSPPFPDDFVFCGEFSAPIETPEDDLWRVADEALWEQED